MKIAILCANENSIYKTIPGLEVYDINRDAYTYKGTDPIIAHPPCAQWSRLKAFAKINNKEKNLAYYCLDKIHENGIGILEHPMGSSFFKEAGIVKNLYSVDQYWFGFPARKRTYLYFYRCKPIKFPLKFDAIETDVQKMKYESRSTTTEKFALWLIECILQSTNKPL